jgi:hypothetical protein
MVGIIDDILAVIGGGTTWIASNVVGTLGGMVIQLVHWVWQTFPSWAKRLLFYASCATLVGILAWFFNWNGNFCMPFTSICANVGVVIFKTSSWGHVITTPQCAVAFSTVSSNYTKFPADAPCDNYLYCLSNDYSCSNCVCKKYASNSNQSEILFDYAECSDTCAYQSLNATTTPADVCYEQVNASWRRNPAYSAATFDAISNLYDSCSRSGIDYLDWHFVFFVGIGIELIMFAYSRQKKS